jgi:putative SOS response-associated peptidase YedK
MCGRFVRHSSLALIEETFTIDALETQAKASYNIAPTQPVAAVVTNGGSRLLDLHWGLVPFWAKDRSIGNRLINARMETAAKKPSFRSAFKKRRCLIVADGFYEWQGEKGRRRPWYLRLPTGGPFGFAGLWETWQPEAGLDYKSCTILTTNASDSVRAIHHRMPVILQPEAYRDWLDPNMHDTDHLQQLLLDGQVRDLKSHPVTKRVNDVANNDPGCIEPAEEIRPA